MHFCDGDPYTLSDVQVYEFDGALDWKMNELSDTNLRLIQTYELDSNFNAWREDNRVTLPPHEILHLLFHNNAVGAEGDMPDGWAGYPGQCNGIGFDIMGRGDVRAESGGCYMSCGCGRHVRHRGGMQRCQHDLSCGRRSRARAAVRGFKRRPLCVLGSAVRVFQPQLLLCQVWHLEGLVITRRRRPLSGRVPRLDVESGKLSVQPDSVVVYRGALRRIR